MKANIGDLVKVELLAIDLDGDLMPPEAFIGKVTEVDDSDPWMCTVEKKLGEGGDPFEAHAVLEDEIVEVLRAAG